MNEFFVQGTNKIMYTMILLKEEDSLHQQSALRLICLKTTNKEAH